MLLKGAQVVSLDPPMLARADLRIGDDCVVARGARLPPKRGELVENCSGLLILPGFVCAHTHMYSALARGMPGPKALPRSFPDMLRKVWWKLDEALDEEAIHDSAMVGAIEAVRAGTTTIIDHHASPNAIEGSLDIIRRAFASVGVRGVLCYEVTDRGGRRRRDAGLAENDRFLAATRNDPWCRGLVGAHASFTLGEPSLAALGDLVAYHRSGIHIHVAEAIDDVERTAKAHGRGIIDRLARHSLLTDHSILAHGVHLTGQELARVRASGAWLAHNPRSNMNNGVGHAPVERFGDRAALGTDGWPADMMAEARFAHFRLRDRFGPGVAFPASRLLAGGQRLASSLFGMPIGTLTPGAAADLVVCEYVAPTPLDGGNVVSHLMAGFQPAMITRVMAGGRWIYRDGAVAGVDVEDVYRRASKVAARLWTRMRG